jgi:hypothetical protein
MLGNVRVGYAVVAGAVAAESRGIDR